MRKIFLIPMLLINLAFLNAKSDELFKESKCKEAYLYHFLNRACSCGDEIGVRILLSQGAIRSDHKSLSLSETMRRVVSW